MKKSLKCFLFFPACCAICCLLILMIRLNGKSSSSTDQNQQVSASAASAASAASVSEPYQPLKDITVILDPGHGGEDPGMVLGRIYEKDINLQIAEKLRALLIDRGCNVFTTRDDDTYISLEDRIKLTEKKKADLFLSIHLNAVDEDTVSSGIESYCNDSSCPGSRQLAEAVQSETVNETCARDRGVKGESNLYVVRKSKIPSCLIEAGFLTSDVERPLLLSDDYQNKIAEGIACGIQRYLTESKERNGR